MKKSNLTVGYAKLPGRVSEGSKAFFNKVYTQQARGSMAGIINRFGALVADMKNATPDALIEALSPTFDKAQKYCPKDTWKLVESGLLEVNTGGSVPKAEISFGGKGKVHYAAIVHERTDLHHAAPTRSKYLQAAVEEDMGKLKGRFARAIKKVMG